MRWNLPPDIKIYEALGAVADGRVHADGNTAKVYSSSGNKFYEVSYDPEGPQIMANDNGSYWKGYLGYPSIAFLMRTGVLPYDAALAEHLKGVAWKDINTRFKNDFDQTLEHILGALPDAVRGRLHAYVRDTQASVAALGLTRLGKRTLPPQGY